MGCKSYKSTTALESVFSKKELKDLQTIRSFFIEEIMKLTDENFHKDFRFKISQLEASGFKSVKPKKLNKLFKSISETTFNEVWETKTQKRSRYSDETYEYFVPKLGCKYQEFLNYVTTHNAMLGHYYDNIRKSGDFSHASMLDYISDNSLDFDLNNTNVQIVMAIDYISICYDNNITNQLIK